MPCIFLQKRKLRINAVTSEQSRAEDMRVFLQMRWETRGCRKEFWVSAVASRHLLHPSLTEQLPCSKDGDQEP